MKKVFSNSECIHTFAQQTQSEGQNSGRSIFFKDKKVYSYGYHYLLGEFIDANTIVINDNGYSNSTSKHINILVRATRQYKQFFTTKSDIDSVYDQILTAKNKLFKAKKRELYILPINSLFKSLNTFLDYTENTEIKKGDKYIEIKAIFEAVQSADGMTKLNELAEKIAKAKKVREAKQIKEQLKKFFSYEINSMRIGNEDFLRVSLDGQKIETTQGVKIEIENAKTLYKMILAKKEIAGLEVQGYQIKSLNGHLVVGCHSINVKNMHKIGAKILAV